MGYCREGCVGHDGCNGTLVNLTVLRDRVIGIVDGTHRSSWSVKEPPRHFTAHVYEFRSTPDCLHFRDRGESSLSFPNEWFRYMLFSYSKVKGERMTVMEQLKTHGITCSTFMRLERRECGMFVDRHIGTTYWPAFASASPSRETSPVIVMGDQDVHCAFVAEINPQAMTSVQMNAQALLYLANAGGVVSYDIQPNREQNGDTHWRKPFVRDPQERLSLEGTFSRITGAGFVHDRAFANNTLILTGLSGRGQAQYVLIRQTPEK